MDLIAAATANAARAVGRAGDLGTLEAGKIGDVIVVAGDPLADIEAMANVQAVVLEGRVVERGLPTPETVVTPAPPATSSAPPASTPAVRLPSTGVGTGTGGAIAVWQASFAALLTAAAALLAGVSPGHGGADNGGGRPPRLGPRRPRDRRTDERGAGGGSRTPGRTRGGPDSAA